MLLNPWRGTHCKSVGESKIKMVIFESNTCKEYQRVTSQSANCLNKKCTLQSVAFLELMPQPHLWNGSFERRRLSFQLSTMSMSCSTGPDSRTSALWQGPACFARTNRLKILWRSIPILTVASRSMIDCRATPSSKPCLQCRFTTSGYAQSRIKTLPSKR